MSRSRSRSLFLMPPEEYLNSVQDNEGATPVFESPELPADLRRQILRRARRIESAVTRRAVERMFRDLPIVRTLAGWFLGTKFGQRAFFNNRLVRSIADRIWYRKMMNGHSEAA